MTSLFSVVIPKGDCFRTVAHVSLGLISSFMSEARECPILDLWRQIDTL